MKTLLVLAASHDLADALKSGLGPARFRVVSRTTVEDAEPLLARGLADACLVDAELGGVQDLWLLERLNQRAPRCPIIVCSNTQQPAWAEQAYLHGVSHVIQKPVSARALEAILERLLDRPAASTATVRFAEPVPAPISQQAQAPVPVPTLNLLRDFSSILTHSHNTDELLKQLLLLMRQMLAVNRAAIFLRPPVGLSPGTSGEVVTLRAAASVGLPAEIVARAQLSLGCGLGAQLDRTGRILRAGAEEIRADVAAQSELEMLGARVAVPMLDRGTLLGVALFDGRLTGEPLVNAELELIFHLLEQAGLAVRNIWLHAQQTANHELLTGVLRELSSACVVVNRDLQVLHANKMAVRYFGAGSKAEALDFADLPAVLGTKLYQVLRTGAGLTPFRFEPESSSGTVFLVTIVPFQRDADGAPASVLLTVEDQTQSEQLRRLELEASDLRMVKNMAHRLVAETGNAIVPLNTFVQIPPDAMDRSLLDTMLPALKDTDKRIERRVKQFRYLAEDVLETNDQLTLTALAEKAFAEAQHYHAARGAQLVLENAASEMTFPANRERLTFAVAEIFMNALQANAADPLVKVRRVESTSRGRAPMMAFEIHDHGQGFTKEAFEQVGKHFFTTRIPGLGLGLAVARKIIEAHGGSLEIVAPGAVSHGVVRVQLPLNMSVEAGR